MLRSNTTYKVNRFGNIPMGFRLFEVVFQLILPISTDFVFEVKCTPSVDIIVIVLTLKYLLVLHPCIITKGTWAEAFFLFFGMQLKILVQSLESVLVPSGTLFVRFRMTYIFYLNESARVWFCASSSEASPNAVLADTSLSPRLNASINSFLLARYFGEISELRIKKSTHLMSFYVMFYPLMSF